MIGVIIAIIFMSASVILITVTLIKMFWRWAFTNSGTDKLPIGSKPGNGIKGNPPASPKMTKQEIFARDMETYKKLEYFNQLNDQ